VTHGTWYEDAAVYDQAFAFPPDQEIAFLKELMLREGVHPPARILEPMIGTGRLVPGLVEAGFQVIGFDISTPMLAQARPRGGAIFRADAAHFALAKGSCDAGHCLIDSFRYLLTLPDVQRFLEAVAHALRPGAPFALGLELDTGDPPQPESWTSVRDGRTAKVTLRSEDASEGLQWLDATVEVRANGGTNKTVHSRMLQRRWPPAAFEELLRDLETFELAGIWRRSQERYPPLDDLPERGGPVTVVLRRRVP